MSEMNVQGAQSAVSAGESAIARAKARAPSVRLAVPSDFPELMRLARMLHEENALFTMDEDLVKEVFWGAFERKSGLIGVIEGKNGKLEGVICMILSSLWYSREVYLEELFNFVRPDCREGAGHAYALVEYAKKCARGVNLKLVIGIVSNKKTAIKVRLYRKYLGEPAGAFFLYDPPKET